MSFKETMKEILAERRQGLGPGPSLEDLIRLKEGRVSRAEKDRILEQASLDPALARQLFDVLNFPGPSNLEEAPEMDLDLQLQAVWDRLAIEEASPISHRQRNHTVFLMMNRRQLSTLAAIWFLTLGGAFLLSRLLSPPAQDLFEKTPVTNLEPVELVSTGGAKRNFEQITLSRSVNDLVVSLSVPELEEARDTGSSYRLILSPDLRENSRVIHGLTPGLAGTFILTVPRSFVTAGQNVWLLEDSNAEEVARFQFHVEYAE